MANAEHLEILEQGVKAWNAWRHENPEVKPDLRDACLENECYVIVNCSAEDSCDCSNTPMFTGINLKNADLTRASLRNTDLSYADLKGANLTESICERANLRGAKLTGAIVAKADFQGAIFSGCILRGVNLKSVNLMGNNLSKAIMDLANLDSSILRGANLTEASLWEASLENSALCQSNLEGANLREANVKNADLRSANLSNACVTDIRYNAGKSRYQGIRVDSCYGSQMFKSHAMDQDYIEEFRAKSKLNKVLYYIWLATSNCGRSMTLWALWSAILLGMFAGIYWWLGDGGFNHPGNPWDWSAPIYFSFVTFSTLGFGDIHPATAGARLWVMAEVMIGYIMLGGLISILANKMARRA